MISWAYLFHAPETDPAKDRFVIERAGVRSTIVAVPDLDAAAKVAAELVETGVRSIELCGYFGFKGASRIIEATGGKVGVNLVTFGADTLFKVVEAFSSAKA